MASNNYPLYPVLRRRRSSSSSSSSSRLNINPTVEDLDSAMGGLSLSIMPHGNSLAATASNVDPHNAILTHPTMEEVSSEYRNNHHVLNNHNNNTGAIVQGAPLASSHDSYYGFSRIEQEINDDDVGEFSVSHNHNNNTRAIVQGAPLASSHDSNYGFSRIEQETNDDHVGEFSGSHNHDNNTRAIVQGAPLASSHDSYYGFSRIEQEINDHDVGEFSVSRTLEGIRGHVATLAMDQSGCRFLQTMVDGGTPQEVEMILEEVMAHTHELMTHHFGNYLVEKIFTSKNLTTHQMERILSSVTRDQQQLMTSCMNDHGTRVAQKMLLSLRNPGQIADTVRALEGITVPLLKNANGGYVIQQCVKLFTPPCQKVIFDEIARNCVEVATDKNGCSVIQKCMAHAEGLPIRLLVQSIILNSAILSADKYGNYVVQYLVKRNTVEPPVIEMIISQLDGCYVELSMNIHGSHVIEALFKHSEPAYAAIIIMKLVKSPKFVDVLQDPYGNYVAQRALEYSTGSVHKTLANEVYSNYAYLRAHRYGKKVLTFMRNQAKCARN
ncbi:hypothetical protein PIB30_002100 [Stylosanthes scabra]|uniref:PUM-HD domain-containing protein n=1 Tax=Stylosanthes scabra TaxID=79078 RepID=A0ABU6R3J2_9FABA|nr:hypothetical protein [Stylosanthes scabra]